MKSLRRNDGVLMLREQGCGRVEKMSMKRGKKRKRRDRLNRLDSRGFGRV
jgi:hypothetical protein